MAIAGGSGLVISVMVARSLGASAMGAYSLLAWIAGTIAALSSAGLPDAISKFVAHHKGAGDVARAGQFARLIFRAQVMAAGIVFLFGAAVWCALDREHIGLVLAASASVMPSALQQTLLALLEGEQRFDLQAAATLVGSILQVLVVALVAWLHPTVMGFLVGAFVSAGLVVAVTFALSRPFLRASSPGSNEMRLTGVAREIVAFSLPVYALWILNLIVFDKSEFLFLSHYGAAEQVAFYGIGFALTARLATAGDSIVYVLFPMFVVSLAREGAGELRDRYRQSIRYLQMPMFPLCCWAIPMLPALIVLAYGKQFAGVAPVVQVLMVTLLFSVSMSVSSSAMYALDRQFSILRWMIPVAVLNIALDFLLIPRWGAVGAAIANGVSQAVAACGLIVLMRRALPGAFPLRDSLKIALAAVVSAAPIFCAERYIGGVLALSAAAAVAILLYILLLKGLRTLTTEESSMLERRLMLLLNRTGG
ncbi:MAG TPA: polysaccharide biosynthesis C-terminal domain-containing protein [Terracidiphilus sp.]|nr:polysaccharide biosynthesis C-terminal domain-containing protein [Terracidiphilus sp.]